MQLLHLFSSSSSPSSLILCSLSSPILFPLMRISFHRLRDAHASIMNTRGGWGRSDHRQHNLPGLWKRRPGRRLNYMSREDVLLTPGLNCPSSLSSPSAEMRLQNLEKGLRRPESCALLPLTANTAKSQAINRGSLNDSRRSVDPSAVLCTRS